MTPQELEDRLIDFAVPVAGSLRMEMATMAIIREVGILQAGSIVEEERGQECPRPLSDEDAAGSLDEGGAFRETIVARKVGSPYEIA